MTITIKQIDGKWYVFAGVFGGETYKYKHGLKTRESAKYFAEMYTADTIVRSKFWQRAGYTRGSEAGIDMDKENKFCEKIVCGGL